MKKSSRNIFQHRIPVMLTVGLGLLALAVAAMVGLWWLDLYHDLSLVDDGSETAPPTTATVWSEEDARCVLFLCSEESQLTGTVLARFDPARGSVTLVTVPTDTLLVYQTAQKTVAAMYADGGPRVVEIALKQTAQMAVDGTAVLSSERFGRWVDNCAGGLKVELPADLETASLSLDAGRHTLTAAQTRHYLADCPSSETFGFLLEAMGRQYYVPGCDVSAAFNRLSSVWATNSTLRRTNYIDAGSLLDAVIENLPTVRTVALPGTYVGEGDRRHFAMPDDMARQWGTLWN